MPKHRIIAYVGVAIAVAWPFVGLNSLDDRLGVPPDAFTVAVKVGVMAVLAWLAFGVQKHPLSFFGIRGVGWRDVGAMLVAMFWVVAVVFVLLRLLQHFDVSGTPEADDGPHPSAPFAIGVLPAAIAGITEEFIYRGFLLEQLGELIQNRWLAGFCSAVVFGIAHAYSGYGWTVDLLYPGLIGLVITALYLRRRNLLICMFIHFSLDALGALANRA